MLNSIKLINYFFFTTHSSLYKRQVEDLNAVIKQLREDNELQRKAMTATSQFMTHQPGAERPTAALEQSAPVNPTPALNADGTLNLPQINQKPGAEHVKLSKRSFILQSDQYNIMFTKLDAVQNLKRLRGALSHGHVNEEVVEVSTPSQVKGFTKAPGIEVKFEKLACYSCESLMRFS